MLPLRWTERAVAQVEAIVGYIALTSPLYAEGVVLRIDQRLNLARLHPLIGKLPSESSDASIRELVVAPYRVFYRVRPDAIEILAIVHGRRDVVTVP